MSDPEVLGALQRQFVHAVTLAELQSPLLFWRWMKRVGIAWVPNLAMVIAVPSDADTAIVQSHQHLARVRSRVSSAIAQHVPESLGHWLTEGECIILTHVLEESPQSHLVDAVENMLQVLSTEVSIRFTAGVSRVAENPSLLPAAVREARMAAQQAVESERRVVHAEMMESGVPVRLEPVRPLDTVILDIRKSISSAARSGQPLEASKRLILEQLVSLIHRCREEGVPVDDASLSGTVLFHTLLAVHSQKQLSIWIAHDGEALFQQLRILAEQRRSQIVAQAIHFITTHLHEDLPLEDIARDCSVSHFYLSHLFRKETSLTVTAFVKKARMEKAMVLLGNPDHTIAEVAYMVGFEDPNYFSKSFRAHLGVTPTEFRRSLTKNR